MKRYLSILLCLALALGGLPARARDAGDWVILVYLTGSDLESDGGAASLDLAEMIEARTSPRVRFIVQTGGAREWAVPDLVPADRLARFEITGGGFEQVGERPLASMGAGETLRDFVSWGLETYQAEKVGLILWDHGSGSINGVCFDELFDMDSLSLLEISQALAGREGVFEFIGFDACLMATLETAQILSPYARYMVASQEVLPGNGWDYQDIGRYLDEEPGAGGAELGERIARGTYQANEALGSADMTTMSVVDLALIRPIVEALDQAGWQMAESWPRQEDLKGIVKAIHQAENCGGNTPVEGYTNMVDIGAMMRGLRDSVPAAQAVLDALEQAVVYRVNGPLRQGATGLSTYYPLQVQGSEEYQIFRSTSAFGGYRRFVAGMMAGAETGQTSEMVDEQSLDRAIAALPPGAQAQPFVSNPRSQLSVQSAYLDSEGSYTLQLTPSSLPFLLSATFTLLMDEGEGATSAWVRTTS